MKHIKSWLKKQALKGTKRLFWDGVYLFVFRIYNRL